MFAPNTNIDYYQLAYITAKLIEEIFFKCETKKKQTKVIVFLKCINKNKIYIFLLNIGNKLDPNYMMILGEKRKRLEPKKKITIKKNKQKSFHRN